MHRLWKRYLPVVAAASLVCGSSWPLTAAAAEPALPAPPVIHLAPGPKATTQTSLNVGGEVIVKLRRSTAVPGAVTAAAAVTEGGGAVLLQDEQSRMVVRLPEEPEAARELITALRSSPDVAYVENNEIMHALGDPPNDPGYEQLWGLARMHVPAAWTPDTTGRSVVVAVVDTGVDSAHPDLAGRVLPGFNAIDRTANTRDDVGHGTHVSGTIAATYNNGVGVTGVAGPASVRILPVKVLDATGSGGFYTVARGIDWAADHGAQVINLSLGGGHSNTVQEAVLRAEGKGVVVVVAAGNDGGDTAFVSPADAPGAVTVAALDPHDNPATFSNHGDQVDVIAPGVDILSTWPGKLYAFLNGTSMAAPHVAGLAALLKAAHPEFTRWGIQACIYASADPISPAGYGYGVPRADRALACDPSALDSRYALKVEGPDPDLAVLPDSSDFWFDVKPGGDRVTVTDSTGAELGAARYAAEGIVALSPDLSRLAPGPATLTATLSDRSGAPIATQTFTVNVAPPGADRVGLHLSTTHFNPARGKLEVTTALSGSTHYYMYVLDGMGKVVKTLVSNQTYTGPVRWDGKGNRGNAMPEGIYYIYMFTDAGDEAFAELALRVPPTPITPTLTVAGAVVNLPMAQVAGKVNANFAVEARVKAPGQVAFAPAGVITVANPDGRFTVPLALTGSEGNYEIQIRGVDPQESLTASRWSTSARVQLDTTAPLLQVTSPAPVAGSINTNQNPVRLAGTAEPGARVTAVAGTGGPANTRTATADSRGGWTLSVPLHSGATSLALTAVDAAGNQSAVQKLAVTLDTTAPGLAPDGLTLAVGAGELSPARNGSTYGFTIAPGPPYVLRGVMSEPIGQVVASNRTLAPVVDGNSFTVNLAPVLRSGTNPLLFDVYDMAGNKLRLPVSVVLDGTRPTVTLLEPDRAMAPPIAADGVTFTVSASEPLSDLRVLPGNGRTLDPQAITRTASPDRRKWTVNVRFPDGDDTWALQFVGIDMAGNVGGPDARARRQVIIDGTSADLRLSNRTDGVIFTIDGAVTVAGTVTDAGAGAKSVTVGRSALTPRTDGSFSTRVTLPEGKLTPIPVVGIDRAGNQQTKTIQVLMKNSIQRLTVNAPHMSPEKRLTISGTTDAPIVLPDQRIVAVVPVTVVITDSLKAVHTYQAEVNAEGAYSVNLDAALFPSGRASIRVNAGVPDDFAALGMRFVTKTATATVNLK